MIHIPGSNLYVWPQDIAAMELLEEPIKIEEDKEKRDFVTKVHFMKDSPVEYCFSTWKPQDILNLFE